MTLDSDKLASAGRLLCILARAASATIVLSVWLTRLDPVSSGLLEGFPSGDSASPRADAGWRAVVTPDGRECRARRNGRAFEYACLN